MTAFLTVMLVCCIVGIFQMLYHLYTSTEDVTVPLKTARLYWATNLIVNILFAIWILVLLL